MCLETSRVAQGDIRTGTLSHPSHPKKMIYFFLYFVSTNLIKMLCSSRSPFSLPPPQDKQSKINNLLFSYTSSRNCLT